jgi:hypothetical protein
MATMLINLGRADEARKQVSLVIANDPAYPILRANYGMSNFISGNFDVTRENFDAAWQLGLRAPFMWQTFMWLHLANEDYDAAEAWMASRRSNLNPEIDQARLEFYAIWIAALRTPTSQNRTLLADHIDNMRENKQLDSNTSAYAFGSIGEPERALEILLWLASVGGYVNQGALWLPGMKSVRTNERFAELTNVIGLTQYWQDVAWPDQCGPTEAGGVQCFR